MNRVIELSEENLDKYIRQLEKAEKSLSSADFNKFILDKCQVQLQKIMNEKNVSSTDYIAGNKTELSLNSVTLYNDSEIDIKNSDTFFNEETKKMYPEKLSLSDLIEYGTGLVGANSSKHTGDEWEYMMSKTRDYSKGWIYNKNGEINHTMGQQGRYIYYELSEYVKEHIDEWAEEYFDKILGSGN